jgi:VWFA-related protein
MNVKTLIGVSCATCLSLASPVGAQGPPATPVEQPQFESRADIVLVDVTVIDRDGRPVDDLTPGDFALEVNGQTRPIHTVQFVASRGVAAPAPDMQRLKRSSTNDGTPTGRLLLFAIDESHLRIGGGRAVMTTAQRLMDTLAPGDLLGLALLPDGGGVEFTANRDRVRAALQRVTGKLPSRTMDMLRVSEAWAFEGGNDQVWGQVLERECGSELGFQRSACEAQIKGEARSVVADASGRASRTLIALERLLAGLAPLGVPVHVILISEGLFVARDRNDVTALARRAADARATLHIVQPGQSIFDVDKPEVIGNGWGDDRMMSEGLEQVAGHTGGSFARVQGDATRAFERIARELSGYYLLGFEPTAADRTSRERRVKVAVRRRGLTVRARSTYAVADRAAAAAAAAAPAADQVRMLLDAPLPAAGLPMRVATYSVTHGEPARVRVILSAEIGEAATEAAEWPVGILVIDRDDRVVVNSVAPFTLEPATSRTASPRLFVTSMVLEPGEYTLRLAAVGSSGAAGSVHHTINASLDAIAGHAIRASDLILTSEAPPGDPPRPMPSSVIFTETMAVGLELAGTDSHRLSAATVEVEVGETETSPALVSMPAQGLPRAPGQKGFAANLALSVLPPGEYVARARVRIPGQADAQITRSFRLAPVAVATDAPPIAARMALDAAPAPLPLSHVVAPVARFSMDEVLEPDVVRAFLDALQRTRPVSVASAPIVQNARQGIFVMTPSDGSAPAGDEPTLAFIRGLAQLEKKQYAQAAAWFQLTLKEASDFLGAAFYLGAVHAAAGRDTDAVGAWQMSLIGGGSAAAYPMLADALLRIGDAQAALEIIAEAPDAWPNDEARQRRVATAQAMLGQFAPALATIDSLLQRRGGDLDLLFMAVQILYRQHLTRPLAPADRTRFDEYADRYIAGKGPDAPLVDTWRKYVRR